MRCAWRWTHIQFQLPEDHSMRTQMVFRELKLNVGSSPRTTHGLEDPGGRIPVVESDGLSWGRPWTDSRVLCDASISLNIKTIFEELICVPRPACRKISKIRFWFRWLILVLHVHNSTHQPAQGVARKGKCWKNPVRSADSTGRFWKLCRFPGKIHAVGGEQFVGSYLMCGSKEGKMGKNLFEENIVWWKKTWCCSEFRFQLYKLFPSSWFVTFGIHTWILDIHSDSLYHKQSNDLGWIFNSAVHWKLLISWDPSWCIEVKSPTSQFVQVDMVGQAKPQHGRKQVWK